MDRLQEVLSCFDEVTHQQLTALGVDIFSACYIVFWRQVREFICEALPVKVLFSVVGLVHHNFIGHLNSLEALLFACR